MYQRLRVDGHIFENAPRVDADIFFKRIKKDAFSKRFGYVWTGPEFSNGLIILFIYNTTLSTLSRANLNTMLEAFL